jgi:glycyl-tRNA synthetase beta chain
VRIVIEKQLGVSLWTLLGAAFDEVPPTTVDREHALAGLDAFIRVRLAGYCRELGYSVNEVDAVIHGAFIADLPRRLEAVRAFSTLPEAASLSAADKRVRNILSKSDAAYGHALDPALLQADAEIALHRAISEVVPRSSRAFGDGDFTGALVALASLKDPVDRFFDEVMVNTDDPAIRANRLGLLQSLHHPMNRVADLSKLAA